MCALVGLVLCSGCGGRDNSGEVPPSAPAPVAAIQQPADQNQAGEQAAGDPVPTIPLRVIRTAEINLVVDDFVEFEAGLAAVVERSQGYIAASRLLSSAHFASSRRSGSWTIRLPQSRIVEGMASLRALGELTDLRSQSQDVTTEFVDLSARVRNKEQEEQRLLTLMEDRTRRLDEVLALERELSRVRGEVERMQAQLRSLGDRTDFSTITLNATEREPAAVAEVPVVPTFAERMSSAFFGSSRNMLTVAEAALTTVVLVVPWIPMIVVAVVLFAGTRRVLGRSDSRPGLFR